MFLWIESLFLNDIHTLRMRMRHFTNKIKGTSFYACQRASLTIEAAVVVPIMIGFLVSILFLFRVLQVQVAIEETLLFVGRELAVESCMLDSQEALLLAAEGHMLETLSDYEIVSQYVKYGKYGIYLGKSDFSGEDIILCAEYEVKLPVNFFEINSLSLSNVNRFRKWSGAKSSKEVGKYVYVTATGRVYHLNLDCRVLDLSVCNAEKSEIDKIRGADGQKYYPCEKCMDNKDTGQIVYYTQYGTRYHKEVSCSALKRYVKKILISDIGDMKGCSFCSQ